MRLKETRHNIQTDCILCIRQSLAGMIAQHSLGFHYETVIYRCKILLSYVEFLNHGFTILFFPLDYSQSLPFYIKTYPFGIENTVKAIWLHCAIAHNLPVRALREQTGLNCPDQPHLGPPLTPSAYWSRRPT